MLAGSNDSQMPEKVKALIPEAWRNAHPVKVKRTGLEWMNLLAKTPAQGTFAGRASPTASILSLGSNGALRVVQHDAGIAANFIEMNYGKRARPVVKIPKPGGKYESQDGPTQ